MSSILGSNSGNMGSPFFHEFKKQASFFLKEKIKTARLALTDVTPAQLLVEEATNGNPGVPDTRTLKMISRAAFEIDDYWRIVEILHKRLMSFDRKTWRASYKALIVLEHLLTHGPQRVAEEFQIDKDAIKETGTLQYVDERGFNWGLNLRRKSERILELLDNRPLLKEERNKTRTIARGIEGFGSFSNMASSDKGSLQESSLKPFAKCNSQFNEHGNPEENVSLFDDRYFTNEKLDRTAETNNSQNVIVAFNKKAENRMSLHNAEDQEKLGNDHGFGTSFKENRTPAASIVDLRDLNEWDTAEEWNTLLGNEKSDPRMMNLSRENDHPFNHNEHLNSVSLLASTDHVLRAF